MQRSDLCKILGVSVSASKEECKKAFHKLAHLHHPDKGGDVAIFKKINGAYQELMKLPDQEASPFRYNPMNPNPFEGMDWQDIWAKQQGMNAQANAQQQRQSGFSYTTSTGSGGFNTIHIFF